jgi:hypothetical protein
MSRGWARGARGLGKGEQKDLIMRAGGLEQGKNGNWDNGSRSTEPGGNRITGPRGAGGWTGQGKKGLGRREQEELDQPDQNY